MTHKFRNTCESRYLYQRFHSKQNSYSLTEAILAFHRAAFSLLPFNYLTIVQAFPFYLPKKEKDVSVYNIHHHSASIYA